MMKRVALFALLAGAGFGCGKGSESIPEPMEVAGTATLANGQPVRNVRVTFHPLDAKLPPASGRVGEDGTFKLKTITDKPGVCPGKYAVAFENLGDDDTALKKSNAMLRQIPVKYQEQPSALEVEVKPDAAVLTIKVPAK